MEDPERQLAQLQQEKDAVFRLDTAFDYQKWRRVEERLRDLQQETDVNIRAQEFIDIFKDIYTAPPQHAESAKTLPPIALIAAFEESMRYLLLTIDESYKEEIVDLQLLTLLDRPDLEPVARDSIKGIFAYYADKARTYRGNEEHQQREKRIHDELVRFLENMPTDPRRARLLSAVEGGFTSYDSKEIEDMRYFAELYALDTRPIEPELSGVVAHEVSSQPGRGERYEKTGMSMSPHQRFFTFPNNRLPTPGVVAEGRAHLALTRGREGHAEVAVNDTEAFFDLLPDCLMDLYLQKCTNLRTEQAYRSKSEEARKEDRLALTRRFVADLLRGAFNQFCVESGTPRTECERLEKIISRYASDDSMEEAIVGAIIDINIPKDS